MPCCGSRAIPKTSSRGTQFFAHAITGNCESENESQEHIFLKTIIAKSARSAGWDVYTEWAGETPNGDKWVADAFCTKGNVKIAFEVQLSYQPLDQTKTRQNKYKESNVRCAWFISSKTFKPGYMKPNKETPCFTLSEISLDREPLINEFTIELGKFVKGMLVGKLTWKLRELAPEISKTEEYGILVYPDICWQCKKPVKQIYGWAIDVYYDQAKTVPNASTILEKITAFASNESLRKAGANTIGRVDSMNGKKVNYPYVNICIHCQAVQNNYYLMEKLREHKKIQMKTSNRFR